jgi:DeoR/GlpR family transcriptional regulator of sugar metabolism
MSVLEESIQKWVLLDNKMRELNEMTKKCREQRKTYEEKIQHHVEKNEKLKNATVQITDGKLLFSETKSTTPLTYKFIETCLNQVISDKNSVEKIIEHIKNSRETESKPAIKRYYN